jgi:hypothetical protein
MLVIIENKAGERYAVSEKAFDREYKDTDFKIVSWETGEPYKAGQPAASETPAAPSVPRKAAATTPAGPKDGGTPSN